MGTPEPSPQQAPAGPSSTSATSMLQQRQQQQPAGPGPGSQALQQQQPAATHHHPHPPPPPQSGLRVYKLLAAGALAGAISRTSTAPMDRLKMIMQIQDASVKGMTIRDGLAKMAAEGSMRAYFRGNGANVVKIAPETALKLTLNDTFKQFIVRDPSAEITPLERMAAGGIAGAVAQFITYPFDTIRTRLAVSAHKTYQGILHAAYCMRRDEGVIAFYRGLVPSMIGILPYAGVDIALFEIFKQHLLDEAEEKGKPTPGLELFGAGMLSSSIAQVVSYPLALIRTRLQAQGVGGASCKYGGMMDVLSKTLAHEGVRGLYKGLLPNICKLAPAAGIGWFVFEETKIWLGEDPHS